jgi:hypothetical protein
MISSKFAHLPNEIIRESVSHTVTHKERNGKLIAQIQKDDPRYAVILTIPKAVHYYERDFPNANNFYVQRYGITQTHTVFIDLKKSYYPDWNLFISVTINSDTHGLFGPTNRSITHRFIAYNATNGRRRIYYRIDDDII